MANVETEIKEALLDSEKAKAYYKAATEARAAKDALLSRLGTSQSEINNWVKYWTDLLLASCGARL